MLSFQSNVLKSTLNITYPLLLFLSLCKQFADVGLRLSDILVQDLWAIDDLWLASVEHFADLPGHQGFTTAWRPKQQDALHVLTPWGKESARKWKRQGEELKGKMKMRRVKNEGERTEKRGEVAIGRRKDVFEV